jgi:hypothetical protein
VKDDPQRNPLPRLWRREKLRTGEEVKRSGREAKNLFGV